MLPSAGFIDGKGTSQRQERCQIGIHKKGRPKAAFADASAALRQPRDQKV
jgi:hypothetical protein